MRTIGYRKSDKSGAVKSSGPDTESEASSESDGDEAAGPAKLEETSSTASFLRGTDVGLMSKEELQHIFGDNAEEATRLLFQHSSRIMNEAPYLPQDQAIKLSLSSRGVAKQYRKAQVHPGVFLEALKSCLNCCPIELSSTECLVILTGGTPEAVVAGILSGHKTIIYVANDDSELEMMRVPSVGEEAEYSLDYFACLVV